MLKIGEFSFITKMPVKTLRFYQDESLLEPDYIDADSGYRYYRRESIDKAIAIQLLRKMDFSVSEIRNMLKGYTDDEDICDMLENKAAEIDERIKKYKALKNEVLEITKEIRNKQMKTENLNDDITIKTIPDFCAATVRYQGRYDDIGKHFSELGKKYGRHICGPAMNFHYDPDYRDTAADIEALFPIKKAPAGKDSGCRIIKGGKAVCCIHRGNYKSIGRTYEKIFEFINENEIEFLLPTRLVYLKGPGLIFRGNPDKYITEVQILLKQVDGGHSRRQVRI